MSLQFKLWLRLVSTDKTAFLTTAAGERPEPGYFSAFDRPTLDGIIENFIASTDWRPVEEIIGIDLSLDVREYARENQEPGAADYGNARSDRATGLLGESDPGAKTIELDSGHLIFLEKQSSWLLPFLRSARAGAAAITDN